MEYKYAKINSKNDTITLSNNISHSPAWETVFTKYKLSKDLKVIEGDTIDYAFSIYHNVALETISEDEIFERKILWLKWKGYRDGWVRLKQSKHLKITNPKGFIIIEGEE